MRPFLGDKGLIHWIRGKNDRILFRRIEGGVIPPKRRTGFVVICGQQWLPPPITPGIHEKRTESPVYWVLESMEALFMTDLIDAMIDLKDEWIADIFWLPKGEDDLRLALQTTEGLGFYDPSNTFLWRCNTWRGYRSKETIASIKVLDEPQEFIIQNMVRLERQKAIKIIEGKNQPLMQSAGSEGQGAMALVLAAMSKYPLSDWTIEEDEKEV
jgi:hypothetical protein